MDKCPYIPPTSEPTEQNIDHDHNPEIMTEKQAKIVLAEHFFQLRAHLADEHSLTKVSWMGDEAEVARLNEIIESINETGEHELTASELQDAAISAWLYAEECPARNLHNSLKVLDARDASTHEEVGEAVMEHLYYAMNGSGSSIRSTMAVFKKGVHIANPQYIQYAGYDDNGATKGNKSNIELTKLAQSLGWKGKGTARDILPLIITMPGNDTPQLVELPRFYTSKKHGSGEECEILKEMHIAHPAYPWLAKLDLHHYIIPALSKPFGSCG